MRRWLAIALVAGFFPAASLADALPRSLLILNEGSAGIQGYADTAAALRESLNVSPAGPFTVYISHILSTIPHKKLRVEKIKLPKRIEKNRYDDQRPMKNRRFVREIY